MALDPRTPVIVGVAQLDQRVDDLDAARQPVELMTDALRRAEADAGASGLLRSADSVRVVSLLSWRYRDPGALIAELLGVSPRQTVYTTPGGQTPQSLLTRTAAQIQDGELDVALLAGAETWRTRMRARRAGVHLDWTKQGDDVSPTETLGDPLDMTHPVEQERGVFMPVQVYPIFETALRAAAGEGVEEHQVKVSELWARFSAVAARNPNAWIREARSAEEIRTPGPGNRMIGFPYPKYMNSNNDVDQAAALVLCSVERARALGVSEDRWVFPHAGTGARDHLYVSNRADLRSSPAMRASGRRALELAGVGVDDLTHVDLYSCFPSAVQIAAAELGLPLDRPLTVTGGMSFAGGPWNNYVMHSIATMVDVLRADPEATGLCTANGGFTTKHAMGVYAARPPEAGFRHDSPQAEVDALPSRELAAEHEGAATVEGYTVVHDREGAPEVALAACLTPEGARTWARSDDRALAAEMTKDEFVGRAARITAGATLEIS